ncbi:hypothetical protein CMU89_00890 [Elizabethkingia anophelis]|uniref:hypothetical protein n=1 Tax=Elizabethkingia TaxID=308865 RepID=UPI00099A1D00|nr:MULTISPECIES: hypothetical protein [Elizabethkingia]MDV3508391.1 hypothetical protein [Elizabethkingia anophelis]MDV3541227.1 hypothetical protein [Elizabethkingia anophelis]MDV3854950.1 hypothetical protein [Elizabethkingia anophelis]MDV3860799.1 hypothetical protein [Elizabethkingia anophelis]MDV3909247.1 hypothetical protein [Elizabethkingia anophelis]
MKNTRRYKILLILFLGNFAFGCDTCKLQQPKITRNFTHGTGPESNWDWFIVGVVILITLASLFYSLKFLIKPREQNRNHIKYSVFSD